MPTVEPLYNSHLGDRRLSGRCKEVAIGSTGLTVVVRERATTVCQTYKTGPDHYIIKPVDMGLAANLFNLMFVQVDYGKVLTMTDKEGFLTQQTK